MNCVKVETLQIFIDTNIIISIFRGNQNINERFRSLAETSNFYFSPIVEAELLQGTRPEDMEKVDTFLNMCHCVDITKHTGQIAGRFAGRYRRSHQGITLDDFFIAASVKEHDFTLWTLNKKHFPMFLHSDRLL